METIQLEKFWYRTHNLYVVEDTLTSIVSHTSDQFRGRYVSYKSPEGYPVQSGLLFIFQGGKIQSIDSHIFHIVLQNNRLQIIQVPLKYPASTLLNPSTSLSGGMTQNIRVTLSVPLYGKRFSIQRCQILPMTSSSIVLMRYL